ncbi:MAG: 2-oxo acid dehydrogenase subunit E2 [Planctomycetota bacterium]|nr:2-oxo acid dehydrogenase subunit E2 [Planctomycetota bacterium]
MATEIKLPSLGDGIDSADVLELFVSEGDIVTKDQGLMELETDKATVTVPSPFAGKIVKLSVAAGQTVAVGSVIGEIETTGAAAPKAAPAAPAPVQAPAPPVQAPAPVAAAPATAPVAAAATPAPQPAKVVAPPPPNPAVAPRLVPVATPAPVSEDSESEYEGVIPAGPAIRRFAREVGVDLAGVVGSGEGGRITREDVLAVVRQGQQSTKIATLPSAPASATTNVAPAATSTKSVSTKTSGALPGNAAEDDYGPVRVEKMSKIRKTIAAQMHRSWTNVPRVTNFDDADVTELEIFRQSSKDDYAARGIKLTTMPFLIKAVATALKHHPSMNASVDMENEQIIYKDYVNIGIAVDTDRGLVVPTLKNVERMGIPDIAQGLGDLSTRVRNNDFGVNDLRGGSFTISNLGAIGGTYSTPIVNVPEVAILLVGRTRRLPVVMEDDSIKPRSMMPLSLAYDHRLVDGGTAARFLNEIIGYLEAPSRLLLAI